MNVAVFLNALVAYFVIVDPVGVSLLFHSLTRHETVSRTRTIAVRVIVISFLIVTGFGFFGPALLGRLGIAMDSFRIAGGLLLFHTAFIMVTHPEDTPKKPNGLSSDDVAVFPLSFPMVAGPGCLTLTILLFSEAKGTDGGLVSVILAIICIFLLAFACFLVSGKIVKTIGETANKVMKRLLGVLLASLAIQFIADGIRGLINQPVA
jgi:multiple antibiotic resistance protein